MAILRGQRGFFKMLDFVRHATAHTPEPVKVYCGVLGALGVSMSGTKDLLSIILLALSCVYTAIKIRNARRSKASGDTTAIFPKT